MTAAAAVADDRTMKFRHLASVLGVVLASCSANAPTTSAPCRPGATTACPCADGTRGTQICNRLGAFGACRCPGVDGGSDGGSDGGRDAGFDVSAPDVTTTDAPVADALPLDAPAQDAGFPDAPPTDAPDGGGDAGPACTGVSLATDGVLDLDVRAARVRGAVTFNGAAAPAASSRGTLTFTRREGGTLIRSLASSGPAAYDLLLAPGTYDVRYEPPAGACSALPAPIPCVGVTVREGVPLAADGVLDLDVQTVLVRGSVTLNGAAFPNASVERGGLTLTRDGGGSVTVPLGASGAATWSARLPRGVYTAAWSPSGAACTAEVGTPCGGGTLRAGVSLSADGVLDLDVPSIRVSGTVTVNGARHMAGGLLTFTTAGGASVIASIGVGGAFRTQMLPDTYDVHASGSGTCAADAAFPCGRSTLRTGLSLRANGVLDLDVRGVRIRGALTVNGAAPNASAAERSIFFLTANGAYVTVPLAATGTYGVFLPAGTYNVQLGAWTCDPPTTAGLPCNGPTIRADVSLTTDGVLDLNVRSVRVRGAATVNGAARSDWSGSVVFAAPGGGGSAPLGADGRYDVLLSSGTYDISWSGLSSCAAASPFPCNGGVLRPGVALMADGVLDVDVRAARIRGAVTLNGAAMPASARGAVEFDAVAGGTVTAPISATGASTYDTTVLAGAYVVSHQGPTTGCEAVPCMHQRLRGCP